MTTKTPHKLPNLPVSLRPGFVPGDGYRSFSSPASIEAYCEALFDRMAHGRQELEEAVTEAAQTPAHLDLGNRWLPWD